MNAASELVHALEPAELARLTRRRAAGPPPSARRLARRYELDLAGLLNKLERETLERLCAARELAATGDAGMLRARLWRHAAEREAGGAEHLGAPYQPVPALLGGKLRAQGPVRGAMPPAPSWPRPVPPAVAPPPAADEPDTLEELLARATALVGVRLGADRRDKGAHGLALAALLGVAERGHAEADWRGEVELKSVPVVRDRSGLWRVKEDPAIAMADVDPRPKLGRVLWLARVADAPDSPLLSWYYQELDAELAALADAHLHLRPKGPRGTSARGRYLHKGYFLASGFLASLNG